MGQMKLKYVHLDFVVLKEMEFSVDCTHTPSGVRNADYRKTYSHMLCPAPTVP
jgi:hypothetical protein